MRPATLVRLALAGTRTDTLRVVLTGFSAALAALAFLAALTVRAIPTPPGDPENRAANYSMQYTNHLLMEPGLRGGLAITLLLLAIPVLALAAQCARLGAPARDRRLAAFRLAGATPGQAIRIAIAETGVATLLGALAGLAVYLVGRRLLHRPDPLGQLALPTDVLPPVSELVGVVLVLPLLAALASAVLLRRVVVTPFGVLRRVRRRRAPLPWPAIPIALGLAVPPLANWLIRTGRIGEGADGLLPLAAFGCVLLAVLGVVSSAGWFSYSSGRVLHRLGRGPAALLAARRLMADPWAGSRSLMALLAALVIAGVAAGFRAGFEARARNLMAEGEEAWRNNADQQDFYLSTMDLVDLALAVALTIAVAGMLIALAEGIVARRRTYAGLVASGVPRVVLARSVAWQVLTPAVPAVLVALTVGLNLVWRAVADGGAVGARITPELPLDHLAGYAAGSLLALLAALGVGLLFLRTSTDLEELRVA
ncbi:FtsX-like permease family protein [Micromonospora sp. NPDC049559]|uniref:FtsX-like permease family protein n=1 Tax=Micromonospora sp. NPDC049559 TaxID=3155923 RepID=UPI00341F7DB2